MLSKVIKETGAIGRQQVDMCLTECITAINEMARHGGFAPVQWVLARYPRSPATLGDEEEAADIGAIQAHVDGPTEFAIQSKYRQEARKQFVNWDCGERVQRGLLRVPNQCIAMANCLNMPIWHCWLVARRGRRRGPG